MASAIASMGTAGGLLVVEEMAALITLPEANLCLYYPPSTSGTKIQLEAS